MELAQGIVSPPSIGIGQRRVLRFKPDGLVEVIDGSLELPKVIVGKPSVVVGSGVFWVESDGLVQVLDGRWSCVGITLPCCDPRS